MEIERLYYQVIGIILLYFIKLILMEKMLSFKYVTHSLCIKNDF